MDQLILGFNIEWFDPISSITQHLYLKFFVSDNTIEILREKSAFLKRIYYPEIKISDLFLGNTLTIHSRLYTIKGYANKFTSDYMQDHEVHFIGVVRSSDLGKVGQVINIATRCNLVISRFFTTQLESSVESERPGERDVEVSAGDTVIEFVGITIDRSTKGLNFNDFVQQVQRHVSSNIIFSQKNVETIQNTFKACRGLITTTPCTLCLVKPHIFKGPKLGDILSFISESYQINGLFSIHLTIPMTEEFFDAYRGVINHYSLMIESMATGPLLAIAVSSKYGASDFGEDIVSSFREFCGPNHPELARILRPKSLRALFGEGLLTNAVHCTDLPDDGEMECRYFFDTLANL